MPPRRAEEVPMKRLAAAGRKLPAQLPAGEILMDITQNKWRLGNTIGYGGFGDIYLGKYFHIYNFLLTILISVYYTCIIMCKIITFIFPQPLMTLHHLLVKTQNMS